MINIVHTRIDYRLIHGQVITKWLKVCNASKIVIIDDMLAKDEFLGMVYKMAAPTGVEVIITTVDYAIEQWKTGEFFNGKVFLLFKTVDSALQVIRKGMKFDELQVGGIENIPGRTMVHNQISLDLADYEKLKEIENNGIKVYFQTVPAEEVSNLEKIKRKL